MDRIPGLKSDDRFPSATRMFCTGINGVEKIFFIDLFMTQRAVHHFQRAGNEFISASCNGLNAGMLIIC